MHRNYWIIGISGILLWTGAILGIIAQPDSPLINLFQEPGSKPVDNWFVCADLGVGPVPEIPDERLRFQLCHADGWELLAYCVQPNLPAPEIGTVCTRIGETEFSCGTGFQNLREYAILSTPVPEDTQTNTPSPTASPTATSSPTVTSSPSPTITPGPPSGKETSVTSPRGLPGGDNYLGLLARPFHQISLAARATPTPFQPQPLTATVPPHTLQAQNSEIDTLDYHRQDVRIRILIQPSDRRVNNGKPIVIKFYPGESCPYGGEYACVNNFLSTSGEEITWVSVHSGVGAQGQAFRNAVEGTSWSGASMPLPQVKANLRALAGAQVTLFQGETVLEGYRLMVVSRVPGTQLSRYNQLPFSSILEADALAEGELARAIHLDRPALVFETCGWNLPGETLPAGISPTSASVYLGIIQKIP